MSQPKIAIDLILKNLTASTQQAKTRVRKASEVLLGPLETANGDVGLRIFNPDGSEAEKSGNGLRIFSSYLFDRGRVGNERFSIDTLGGLVESTVHEGGRTVTVHRIPPLLIGV